MSRLALVLGAAGLSLGVYLKFFREKPAPPVEANPAVVREEGEQERLRDATAKVRELLAEYRKRGKALPSRAAPLTAEIEILTNNLTRRGDPTNPDRAELANLIARQQELAKILEDELPKPR